MAEITVNQAVLDSVKGKVVVLAGSFDQPQSWCSAIGHLLTSALQEVPKG